MTGAIELIRRVVDEASFQLWDPDLVSTDPLGFVAGLRMPPPGSPGPASVDAP